MEVISSGRLVPIATIVSPIIASLTPIDFAIDIVNQVEGEIIL